jgi:glyoxylase-like metal-dependent hydrolase (beta-lactamase superfamily II)
MAAVAAPLESVRLGNTKITWLPDGVGLFKATAFIVPTTDEQWARHPEDVDADGMMVASLGGVLVETPTNTVLIDVGIGDHKLEIPIGSAQGGEFMKNLARAGMVPDGVDTVVYTHLHADHVGWSSAKGEDGYRLRFPRARHIMHRDEWKFWEGKDDHTGMPLESLEVPLRDSVKLLAGDESIVPGLNLVHTPGHTPGHSSVVVTSGNERVYILGDVLHSPAQVSEEWACFADTDPAVSRATREAMLRELQKPGTVTAATHFPNSIFGRVIAVERKLHWVMGTTAERRA